MSETTENENEKVDSFLKALMHVNALVQAEMYTTILTSTAGVEDSEVRGPSG